MMSNHYTYIWYDPKTSIPVYVGKGKDLRWRDHVRRKPKTRIQFLLAKRKREGYEEMVKIIPAVDDADAIEMEMLLIAMVGREDQGTGTLFNLTDGGDGRAGRKWSEETRQKNQAYWDNGGRERQALAAKQWQQSEDAKAMHDRLWKDEEFKRRHAEKTKLATAEALQDPTKAANRREAQRKAGVSNSRPCTIDGVTIYPSRAALAKALGQSKDGARSPNFRYVK